MNFECENFFHIVPFYATQSSLLIADKYNEIYFFADSLTKKDVKVLSLKEQLDTSTPQGRFMLTIFGAIDLHRYRNRRSLQSFSSHRL